MNRRRLLLKKQQEIQRRVALLQGIIRQYDQVKRKLNHSFASYTGYNTNQYSSASKYFRLLRAYSKRKSMQYANNNSSTNNNNNNNNNNENNNTTRRRYWRR